MHKGRRRGKDWVSDLSMRFFVARLLVTALTVALALAGLVVLGFAGAHQFLEPEIPDAAELREVRTQMPLAVYSRDGKLIAQIGEQRRIPVAWEEVPPLLVDAFLAAEDDRFFRHPGVDWQGLVRAAISNVTAGGVREGGGTITMQLARNTVLTNERTLRRKLKEVFLALRLEREFSKQEILTLYLNRIFLGQRAYGVGAAAQVYFDKRPAELTLAEAALVAGLPRSPSLDNPVASVERARDRRAYVLRRMVETGKITEAESGAANAVPIVARIHGPVVELSAPYIAEMARLELVRMYGDAALTEGYRVTTTVDSRLQAAADAAARRTLLAYDRRHGYRGPIAQVDAAALGDAKAVTEALRQHPDRGGLVAGIVESVLERSAVVRRRDGVAVELGWDDLGWARPALPDDVLGPAPKAARDVLAPGHVVYLEPLPEGRHRLAQVPAVAGALVALEPRNGAIVALAGGFDFGASKYNRAVQARRQPGSAFKPFVYSAALERGFTPASLINDAPIVMTGGGGTEEWRPQNITKRFYGPTPLREALVRSRNLVSIRLLRATGIGPAMRHISAFGFGPEALPANLTLALGTGQVTPLEMARGFSVFANGGFLVTPYIVERVTDSEGSEVFAATPAVACADCPGEQAAPQAISPANAFVMTDVMTDVIQRGTATSAKSLGRSDLAGKTGTTSDRRDAWFVGFNADVTAAAWVGFDQERSLGDNEEGGRTALPMWIAFMEEALRDQPEHRLPEPPGVVRMWVDRSSGRPASAGASGAVFEAFLEAHVPQGDALAEAEEVGAESVEPATADDTLF
jgi:penicillin-binding protein 1A